MAAAAGVRIDTQAVRIFRLNSSQFEAKPDEVDHWTPYSHWCAGCWHWVVDCEHLVDPLPLEHHPVEDVWIRSLAYNRVTQCLEVRFKWKAVDQYRPVSVAVIREIWKARPMNVTLNKLVMKNRGIRFDEVRTEGTMLVSPRTAAQVPDTEGRGTRRTVVHGPIFNANTCSSGRPLNVPFTDVISFLFGSVEWNLCPQNCRSRYPRSGGR